ncbi:MAG: T9SS type A sorting domain-containing protein [Fluviicola sp.]
MKKDVTNQLVKRYACRTVFKSPIMNHLLFFAMMSASLSSYAQSSDNEILEAARLRADCVERSLCKVDVYPNPSTGPVHVDAPKGATCMVYSTAGTYVGTWEVGEEGLDLVDLPTGTFITAVSYNGIKRTSRIVILD